MTSSKKNLSDELRSVLLSHSLDAPDADDTVHWVLARTVGTADQDLPVRRRRLSAAAKVLAAVAALVLVVGGVNELRTHSPDSGSATGSAVSGVSTAGPDAAAGGKTSPSGFAAGSGVDGRTAAGDQNTALPAIPAPPAVPAASGQRALDCTTLPGGHLVHGSQATVLDTVAKRYRFVYEFYCAGSDGSRSASVVQEFQQVDGRLSVLVTLVDVDQDVHVDYLESGTDQLRVYGIAHTASAGKYAAGDYIAITFPLGARSRQPSSTEVQARACTPSVLDLALITQLPVMVSRSVDEMPALTPSVLLTLHNTSYSPCALEGYPLVTPDRGVAAVPTLSGAAGGLTTKPVPPVINLEPGGAATALVEIGADTGSGCVTVSKLTVVLPDGGPLGTHRLVTGQPVCHLTVHPFVDNETGSN